MRREVVVILIGILITVAALVAVAFTLSQRQAATAASETLDLATNLAADGKWADVIQMLTPLSEGRLRADQRDRLLTLLAEAHAAAGDQAQALAAWERLAAESRDPAVQGRARFALATAALESGGDLAAVESHLAAMSQLNAPGLEDRVAYLRGRLLEARGDKVAARQAYLDAWHAQPAPEIRDQVEQRLGQINLDLLFSPQPYGADEIYVIQRGDTLDRLGRRFGVSPTLLERVNGLNPRNLTIGRRIKIPRHAFRVEVYKDSFQLVVFDGADFFVGYPCRLGRVDYMTPEQTMHIETKTKDPEWRDPATGRRYPPGDPGNELGTRWMGFRENPSLGIHGTIHPETIGTAASNGCVGLLREDIEVLFDLLPRGTEVRIFGSRAEADALRAGARRAVSALATGEAAASASEASP